MTYEEIKNIQKSSLKMIKEYLFIIYIVSLEYNIFYIKEKC